MRLVLATRGGVLMYSPPPLRVSVLFHWSVSAHCRKMIADIFGESGDEEEEEFTVSVGPWRLSEALLQPLV